MQITSENWRDLSHFTWEETSSIVSLPPGRTCTIRSAVRSNSLWIKKLVGTSYLKVATTAMAKIVWKCSPLAGFTPIISQHQSSDGDKGFTCSIWWDVFFILHAQLLYKLLQTFRNLWHQRRSQVRCKRLFSSGREQLNTAVLGTIGYQSLKCCCP